jgi:hypothetical protein
VKIPLAVLFPQSPAELVGFASAAVLVAGVWLNWRRQEHIEEIEEDVKNGTRTADQAWRRMRFVNWRAQGVVFLGLALLVVALLEMME